METIILLPVIGFYVVMVPFFFLKWIDLLQRDLDVSLEEYQINVFVAIAALCWPLILPFAYLDLLENSAQ
jgi:hypothetical protein